MNITLNGQYFVGNPFPTFTKCNRCGIVAYRLRL